MANLLTHHVSCLGLEELTNSAGLSLVAVFVGFSLIMGLINKVDMVCLSPV